MSLHISSWLLQHSFQLGKTFQTTHSDIGLKENNGLINKRAAYVTQHVIVFTRAQRFTKLLGLYAVRNDKG